MLWGKRPDYLDAVCTFEEDKLLLSIGIGMLVRAIMHYMHAFHLNSLNYKYNISDQGGQNNPNLISDVKF